VTPTHLLSGTQARSAPLNPLPGAATREGALRPGPSRCFFTAPERTAQAKKREGGGEHRVTTAGRPGQRSEGPKMFTVARAGGLVWSGAVDGRGESRRWADPSVRGFAADEQRQLGVIPAVRPPVAPICCLADAGSIRFASRLPSVHHLTTVCRWSRPLHTPAPPWRMGVCVRGDGHWFRTGLAVARARFFVRAPVGFGWFCRAWGGQTHRTPLLLDRRPRMGEVDCRRMFSGAGDV